MKIPCFCATIQLSALILILDAFGRGTLALVPRQSVDIRPSTKQGITGQFLFIKMVKFLDNFNFDKIDAVKEAHRRYRRTVFTISDWKAHRSSNRYLTQLLSMPKSNIVRSISNQVIGVTINSVFIVLYNYFVVKLQWNFPLLSFSSLPFSLTSSSLGLLLVFRTNAAYSRWKDARIAWATIASKSKSLIRQAVCWFPEKDRNLKADFIKYLAAFSKCLIWQLRNPSVDIRLRAHLSGLLTEAEIEDIMISKYRSQRILMKLSDLLRKANLLPNVQCHVDKGICDITDAVCVCERIFSTPIPLIYTRHTARFLFLWLLTVPMSLYHDFKSNKWAVIPM